MKKDRLIKSIESHLNENVSIDDIFAELENYICPLTEDNSIVIEHFIEEDPKYKQAKDKMFSLIEKLGIYHNNSSIEIINKKLTKSKLKTFVWNVAIANSIQGKRRDVKKCLAEYIFDKGCDFYKKLKKGNYDLVEKMESHVHSHVKHSRHECSWCSKVCKFLHDALFNNDKYYIYDGNVKSKLNDYLSKYKLEKIPMEKIEVSSEEHWYTYFCDSLEKLKTNVCPNLTRSQIDHIIWGYKKCKIELDRLS